MTDVQEKPTLTFEDNNYVLEDLSDRAKYIVGQLQDLLQQMSATRARLDQIEVCKKGFEDLLREELAEEPAEGEIVEPPMEG
jgi:prefoldin subunit 5